MSTTTMNAPAETATTTDTRRISNTSRIRRLARLHFADRTSMVWTPPLILGATVVVMIVIFLMVAHFTSMEPAQLTEGFRQGSQAPVWIFPGFAIAMGVLAYARTMPYAIGMMGSTRRQFWLGTMLWIVLQTAYMTALATIFLLVENLTGGWFVGVPAFGAAVVGGGEVGTFVMMMSALVCLCLTVGTALSAIYLRWGTNGVWVGIVALVLVVLLAIAAVLGTGVDLLTFLSTHTHLKFAALLVGLTLISAAVSWAVIRRVPINR